MPRGRPAQKVVLTPEQRSALQVVVGKDTSPQRDVLRARIALMAADGVATTEIAKRLGVSVPVVCKWRKRVAEAGPKALVDKQRSGRPRRIDEPTKLQLIALACEPLRTDGGRTTPTLDEVHARAEERGIVERISRSHLHRLLQAGDVRPHRVRMWLHSPDPEFRRKVNEICDLYHTPPKGSVVLSIDEKTGMQAVERKHPDRDPQPCRARRREFEYLRHGTQSLIAALNVHTGVVTGECGDDRRGDTLEAFMERVAAEHPDGDVHIVWDNLNTHKGMKRRWNAFNERHGGRFHFHFTPVHASWVNQIELWFGILGKRCLRNASFTSKEQLRAAVLEFVETWNLERARPFRWTFRGYPLQTGNDE